MDDYSVLRSIENSEISLGAKIFDVRDALMWEKASPLGLPGKAFQGDKDRTSVVLSCSDYFTDRGEYQQALALYNNYHPVMQSHQDFYSRLAYVALKNEKFTQAVGVYQRLLQLDPKNARWWLGLGWAFRGQGEAKLAHDAYAKAYKYALPGAEFKPFLQSVLQDG